MAAFTGLSLGVSFWIIALWVENDARLPGRIIATVTWALMAAAVGRVLIRYFRLRAADRREDTTPQS